MRIVTAAEVAAKSSNVPHEHGQLLSDWIEGPFNGDRLDVKPLAHLTVTTRGYTFPDPSDR